MEPTSPFSRTSLEADQPLARLLSLGSGSLSNAEVLSLLLTGTASAGSAGESEAAHLALSRMRSLGVLARCSVQELVSLAEIGVAHAARIVAAGEFGRRVAREYTARFKVDDPAKVCQLMIHEYRGMSQESVRVLLLDTKAQLLRIEEVSLGSLNVSIAHPREIFRAAIVHGASSIILAHNHPSGDPTPSVLDQRLTARLVEAGKFLGIGLDDHIIIGAMRADGPSYYSFKEAGKIRWE